MDYFGLFLIDAVVDSSTQWNTRSFAGLFEYGVSKHAAPQASNLKNTQNRVYLPSKLTDATDF
jgi:hypothetical protein